jgi:6-pyruvoyltetrahydropterin/6-carboxytetrahydropterin synthase
MIFEIKRRFTFCAAHRLPAHPGKCRGLHGHNYSVEVTVGLAAGENGHGNMVMDFGDLKDSVGRWIDANWDHATILQFGDEELASVLAKFDVKLYLMNGAPTAENMARVLAELVVPLALPVGVVVRKISIWETENCVASVIVS